MYSERMIESARKVWNQAPALARRMLLKDAGYQYALKYAYLQFDELPALVIVDLNAALDRHIEQEHA